MDIKEFLAAAHVRKDRLHESFVNTDQMHDAMAASAADVPVLLACVEAALAVPEVEPMYPASLTTAAHKRGYNDALERVRAAIAAAPKEGK